MDVQVGERIVIRTGGMIPLDGKVVEGEAMVNQASMTGEPLPVAKRLNIDFGIGIGYSGGKYKSYYPDAGCYVYIDTKRRHWFGPTRAEVSLVWLLGRGNVNSKKGGAK